MRSKHRNNPVLDTMASVLFLIGVGAVAPACGSTGTDDGGGDETGGGCTDGLCCTCASQNKDAWQCYDYYSGAYHAVQGPAGSYEVCATSEVNAITACEDAADADSVNYTSMNAQLAPCYSNSGSCTGWSPSTYVAINNGIHEIDDSFVDTLISDPSALSSCDTGRFTISGSHYTVSGISSGDLLDELGLENGDIIQTVNRVSIDDWDDAAAAFTSIINGTTYFDVVVNRSGTNLTLSYSIVP